MAFTPRGTFPDDGFPPHDRCPDRQHQGARATPEERTAQAGRGVAPTNEDEAGGKAAIEELGFDR